MNCALGFENRGGDIAKAIQLMYFTLFQTHIGLVIISQIDVENHFEIGCDGFYGDGSFIQVARRFKRVD